MDWIIPVSTSESSSGQLSPQTLREALAAFREYGGILLRGVFKPSIIDAMYRDYTARYGAYDAGAMHDEALKTPPNSILKVGEARYEIALRMNGEFGSPHVLSNGLVRQLLLPLLGKDIHLSSLTVVVSYPGSELQHIHRDYSHLFEEGGIGSILPVYAVNVAVPLIDVDIETGPTGFWPGSHRWPSAVEPEPHTVTVEPLHRGDCMLLDYRTLHAGLPNCSRHARPILYLVYARSWFFDEANHRARIPLDMSLEDYSALPEPLRPLLVRAFSQAIRNSSGR